MQGRCQLSGARVRRGILGSGARSRRRHVLVERVWRVCVLDQHCWWRVWGPVCHTVGVGGSVGLSHVGVNVCFGLYTIRTLIFQGPKANLEARNFPVMCELVAF